MITSFNEYSLKALLFIGDVGDGALYIGEKIYEFTLKPSVDRAITVYNNMKTDPNVSGLMLTYVVVGCFIADNVGVGSLSNAFDGHDFVDNRELSMGERVFEGVSGAFDLVSTAIGGLNVIKSGIRATGQCDKLGKYFTDCCFLQLRGLSALGLHFKCEEVAADAADDIRDAGCAVHAAMLLPAEATRDSFQILYDVSDNDALLNVFL